MINAGHRPGKIPSLGGDSRGNPEPRNMPNTRNFLCLLVAIKTSFVLD